MIKLAVFDIDGTLIDRNEGFIRPSVIEVFKKLKKSGIKVVIATGRTYFIIQNEIFERLDFDYVISGNGTKITDSNNNVLYGEKIDPTILKDLIADLYKNGDKMSIEFSQGLLNINGFEKLNSLGNVGDIDVDVDFAYTGMGSFPSGKVDWYIKKYPNLDFISAGITNNYDAVPKGVNKRKALGLICKKLNISQEEIVAVGDGINDIDMLNYAGLSIAMGNSCDELKEISDYITDDVTEDGIRNAFIKLKIISEDDC